MLKKPKDVDKWSSLSLCLPVIGMSVTCEPGLSDGLNNVLSPILYRDIVLSENTQYST